MIVGSSANSTTSLPKSVGELLDLDDEAFVLVAYRAILGREADHEGFTYYVRRVRSGVGKLQILGQLRFSPEGRGRAVTVDGLDWAIRIDRIKRTFGMSHEASYEKGRKERRLEAVENMLHGLTRVTHATNQHVANLHSSIERLRIGPVPAAPMGLEAAQPDEVVRVSILTPAYKTSPYYLERLAASLWSVRHQIEWVLVNDSPDAAHIDEFAAKMQTCFPHMKYVRHPHNMGIFSAYTSGVNAATAPYVAILDHDDEVDLTLVLAHLKQTGERCDLIYTDEIRFGQDMHVRFDKPSFDPLSAMHYFYMHHITLFRTSICKELIQSDRKAAERYRSCFDIWLAFSYIHRFGRKTIHSHYIAHPSYGWRVHDNSTAKSLGQKPLADSERIEIARKLYQPFYENIQISLDTKARYVVRYAHPIASADACEQFAQYVTTKFELLTPEMSNLSVNALAKNDALLGALASVPIGYLHDFIEGKCFVIRRSEIPKGSELNEKLLNHIDGVPVLEAIDSRADSFERDHLRKRSLGVLIPREIPVVRREIAPTHMLIV